MKYVKQNSKHNHSKHNQNHNHNHHNHHNGSTSGNSSNGSRSGSTTSSSSSKRLKKHSWGTRERTGMSFLIVIAFFAVFGIIILTEIFMIDERAHSGIILRGGGGGYGNRLGDSMPDYDNVKDDYDLIDVSLLGDSKFGFVQFQDNKYKIQDIESNGVDGTDIGGARISGVLINSNGMNTGAGAGAGAGGGGGSVGLGVNNADGGGNGLTSASMLGGNAPLIPWGKALPAKVEDTLPHYPAGMTATDGSWQIVNGTRFKFFVFSAYYDRRDGGKLIRVIGATKTRGPERVWCRMWYSPANQNNTGINNKRRQHFKSVTVIARVKVIRENWNLKYSACFVLCPIRALEYDVPRYISIVARLKAPPGNLLLIRNTDWDPDFQPNQSSTNSNVITTSIGLKFPRDDEIPEKLAVCVKPFHFDYDQALYLMEYLEFYALLGVSHFTFYNHTIGLQADCVLQHYMKDDIPDTFTAPTTRRSGIHKETRHSGDNSTIALNDGNRARNRPTIQMLPWNLRMRSQKEIRTEGLFAALNDCLYRTMYRFKYLALVDLDEFIVPRHNDTLIELINSLNVRFRNRNTGAYSFQNAFFYLQFADDPLLAQIEENEPIELAKLRAALVTQRKTRRRFKLHPQKQRSKYICKPEAVVEAGNHFVWEFVPGKGSFNVPPADAILQHYRVCEFGGNDCIKAPSTLDRTATKYVKKLMARVYNVYKHLKHKCRLPDLPPLPKVSTQRSIMVPLIRKNDEEKRKETSKTNDNEISNEMKRNRNEMKTTIPNDLEVKANASHGFKIGLAHSIINKTTTSLSLVSQYLPSSMRRLLINTTTTTTTRPSEGGTGVIGAPMPATESPNQNVKKSPANKRKRKVVVFFVDDKGQPRARLEYH